MNELGRTVTEVPEHHLIHIHDRLFIIDLAQITIGDWMAIVAETDKSKQSVAILFLCRKVLGPEYLSLPIVFMQYVNQRVLDAITALFSEGKTDESQ